LQNSKLEKKHISNILYVPIIKKNLLLIGSIVDFGFNVGFLLNTRLIKNIRMKAIVLKCTRINMRVLYKLEAKPYLNFEVNIIFENLNASFNPTIPKTIFRHHILGHLNFEALHKFTNRERALGIPKLPRI
jgi:hypothetical protein